ncbi:MAG: C39 family peptidase [Actinocatenispora sp.]
MRNRSRLGLIVTALLAVVAFVGLGSGAASASVSPAAESVLPYTYQAQETGYWCSAAAAKIALSARGVSVSQSELASYMNVTPDVGLPDIGNLESALDTYEGTTYYEVKQWSSDSELASKLQADVLYNVDRGHAVVINVIRIADASFPGGHYATIVGYRNGGSEYLIADPASSARSGIWLGSDDVASGIKLRRYVA